ncbi:MAG: nicotinate (nicotinamide) nucleotide adenylyltransferase [Chitinophagaceae bacterium]
MKVGLFFGSFNPIHTGHCIIASHIVSNTPIDQVWIVVSPQNPFKSSSTLLNEYDRLHLVHLAVSDEKAIKPSDVEFHLPRPSYTIDTLLTLDAKYPMHRFTVIMGSDGFENFPKWKNASMILKHYALIIYRRPGFPIPKDLPENVQIVDAPLLEISATHIRETVRQQKSIRYLVPDAVKSEIETNGYYQ